MVAEPWCGGSSGDAKDAHGEVGGRDEDVNEEQSLPEETEVEPEVGDGDQEEAEGPGEIEEDVDGIELRKICDGILRADGQEPDPLGEHRGLKDVLLCDEGRLRPIPCRVGYR